MSRYSSLSTKLIQKTLEVLSLLRPIVHDTSKGPFIATQLNSTRRRVELCRYKRAVSFTN